MKTYLFSICCAAALCVLPVEALAASFNESDINPLSNRYNDYYYRSGGEGPLYWYYTRTEGTDVRVLYLTQRWNNGDPWHYASSIVPWMESTDGVHGWYDMIDLDTYHYEGIWNYNNDRRKTQIRCNYTIRSIAVAAFEHSNVEEFYYFIVTNDLSRDDRYHEWGENAALTSHMELIDRYAFAESRIKYMEIGPKVTSIGEFAFYKCYDLQTFTSFNPEPPEAPGSFYDSNAHSATLVVPVNCVSKYKTSGYWNMFGTIQDMNGRPYDDATSIRLDASGTVKLNVGATRQLTASLTPAVAGSVTWSSSDPDVAAVSNAGLVTVRGNGIATVTARTANGLTASVVFENGSRSDATLRSLAVGGYTLSPAFHPDSLNYNVSVPYTTENITLTAEQNYSLASVAGAGEGARQLSVGDNTFRIVVTAQDNLHQQTYTVTVYRKSNDASLRSLKIDGTLLPGFHPDTLNYTVAVPHATEEIMLAAEQNHSPAAFTGAGTKRLNVGDNTFRMVVTAEDNLYQQTYTVTVHRKSNDATLHTLSINGVSFSPGFNPDTLSYTARVPYSTKEITIVTSVHPTAGITSGGGSRSLNPGINTLPITVTAEDGNQQTYTLSVHRQWNAFLNSLIFNPGTLSPAFNSDTLNYTATVPFSTESITLLGVPNNAKSDVNGDGPKQLSVGDTTFIITVTPEDNPAEQRSYSVKIHRQSNDATLNALQVTSGTLSPDFNPAVFDYEVIVPYATENITLAAVTKHASATFTGDGAKQLNVGDTAFHILVSAEDAVIKQPYTVSVHRKSNDATLRSLSVDTGALSPAFHPDTLHYTVTVPYSASTVTFTAIKNYAAASVEGDERRSLAVGDNPFPIKVISEDGNSLTYTVTVHRVSNDALLWSLTLDRGYLSPAFHPNIFNYTAAVDGSADTVLITARTGNQLATVTGDGKQMLNFGKNTFEVTATSEDNSARKTYAINIYQQRNDATLQSLRVDEADLNPSFDTGIFEYDITVPSSQSDMVITAETTDSLADVSGIGRQDLLEGDSRFDVRVTAEDGSIGIYTINVIRISDDATLKSLSVSAGSFSMSLDPPFDPGIHYYEASLPHNLATVVTISAETNHPLADVAGAGLLALPKGDHAFQVDVTTEYGNRKTYELNIIRVLPTGLRASGEAVQVYVDGGMLHIHTPAAERIEIYSVSGAKLYVSEKPAGELAVALSPAAGVWIVRGSSGWVRKGIFK